MVEFINLFLLYNTFTILIFCSLIGFGKTIKQIIVKTNYLDNYINLNFIFGLIFIGFFSIIYNFFYIISDLYSLIILFIGVLFYFLYFFKEKKFKKEIYSIFYIVFISFCFSFYSGINDDFNYHFETINNFKQKNIFEIGHYRNISYNSHWLFLNSIFYISYFKFSIYILTSLLYSITIYDLYILYIKKIDSKDFVLIIFTFLSLVFLLGVINQHRNFGTDFPGLIICIYSFIIYIELIENKKLFDNFRIFIVFISLCLFAFIIKISNSLILILIPLLLFRYHFNLNKLILLFISFFPLLIWFLQNFFISKCIIWPINILCFENIELAKKEFYFIESFAKGDINTSIDVNGFSWISTWIKNHFKKIFEIYFIFSLIIFIPILYYKFKIRFKFINLFSYYYSKNNYINFYFYLIPIFLFNIMWFLIAPAYRFGVFYNLTLIIFIFIPFWLYILTNINTYIIKKIFNYMIIISLIFFIYENSTRIGQYIDRYDNIWPPIINNKLIEPK